jgi:hypothetical protein
VRIRITFRFLVNSTDGEAENVRISEVWVEGLTGDLKTRMSTVAPEAEEP